MERIRKLFGGRTLPAFPQPGPIEPVRPRVLMIVHNPPLATHGGKRVTEVFGWNDPAELARQYITDLRLASGDYLQYEIVERIDSDSYPRQQDGFQFDEERFLSMWNTRSQRQGQWVDYHHRIREFDLATRFNRGDFDEMWWFAYPFTGDYESIMAGPGAFWCNAPAIPNIDGFDRRFCMMMFNYERGVDCMLENFGHRTESILREAWKRHGQGENLWERFIRYDQSHPGQAECGNVHFAPSSQRDYDWGNPREVPCRAHTWLNYPDLAGQPVPITCAAWGNGDMRLHHLWWLRHLPRAEGWSNGLRNNWWAYVVDPGLV